MPEAVRMPATAVALAELDMVNHQVNRDAIYVSDQVKYHQAELWAIADRQGDCEDFALAKLKKLRMMGWPKGSLDIGICKVGGIGHAVLIAHTDQGDLVLDNNHAAVRPWSDPEYHWIEVSVGGSFATWRKVEQNASA